MVMLFYFHRFYNLNRVFFFFFCRPAASTEPEPSAQTQDPALTVQLSGMGFSESQVTRAFSENQARPQENQSRYIQRLVGWLIDHPVSDDADIDDNSDDDFEINHMEESEVIVLIIVSLYGSVASLYSSVVCLLL